MRAFRSAGQDPYPVFDLAAGRVWLTRHGKPILWDGPPPDDLRVTPEPSPSTGRAVSSAGGSSYDWVCESPPR
ncbi:hypothetical protein GCM10010411_73290 [Actinomadura fulvescens]|uniref:Uncharacterized protein n=1 Tax=Actinomadura fulvescens TaxID=46160 RepID=A0ABP6CV49_9ACTN